MQQVPQDYRPVFELASVGQSQVDIVDGRILRANEAFCAMVGYSSEELVGKTWLELTHPDDVAANLAAFRACVAGELGELVVEKRYLRKDGTVKWAFVTAVTIRDDDGNPRYNLALIHDIDARKRAELNASFLARLGEALIPVTAATEAIDLVTRAIAEHLGVDGCSLAELDIGSTSLTLRSDPAVGLFPGQRSLPLARLPASLTAALAAGQPVIVEDTATDPRTVDYYDKLYAPQSLRAIVAVPRQRDGLWAAALVIAARRPRAWHPDELAFLGSVADLVWLAIERLRSLEQLRDANQRLTLALSGSDGFIYDFDPVTRAVTRSDGLRQVTGFAPDEVPANGTWWNARIHPEDYQRAVTDGIADFDSGFTGYSLEYRILHRDGHYVDVWDRAIVQRDEAGRAVRVFGHTIDMSARKRAERLLQERIAEFETLMATAPVAIWLAHDAECQVITGNPAGYRLLRLPEGSNLSLTAPGGERPTSFRVLHDGDELAGEELPMQYSARHGVPVNEMELDLVFGEGDVTTVFGYAAPLFDAAGKVRGCIAVYVDVSERRRSEEERARLFAAERSAREEAQAAVRSRDAFLSIAAHELKTPLTVMLGNAQLLQRRSEADPAYSERDRRAIAAVAAQTLRLERMIAVLLDISRIEAGQLRITRAPFDLRALALRLVQEVRPTLRDHTIVYLGDDPVYLDGDELRIEQVLQNLISNAVKYSPGGGHVRVSAAIASGQATVTVSDEGIGIPTAELPNVFSRFFRASNAGDHQVGGIGLGLFVVKEIIALHGGEVQLTSDVGQGTTVSFTLPGVIAKP